MAEFKTKPSHPRAAGRFCGTKPIRSAADSSQWPLPLRFRRKIQTLLSKHYPVSLPAKRGSQPAGAADLLHVCRHGLTARISSDRHWLTARLHPARQKAGLDTAVLTDPAISDHRILCLWMKWIVRIIGIRLEAEQFAPAACPLPPGRVGITLDAQRSRYRNEVSETVVDRLILVSLDPCRICA
jgi:hypothetical protein